MPRQCPKCEVIISKPDANYCNQHAGKNPKLSKEYETRLIAWAKKRFPPS